jgi:hypothetical protein
MFSNELSLSLAGEMGYSGWLFLILHLVIDEISRIQNLNTHLCSYYLTLNLISIIHFT